MSKYIIIGLSVLLVTASITIGILIAKNKILTEENAKLENNLTLKDKAFEELGTNIELIQNQVAELETICNEQLQARNDLIEFLNIDKDNNSKNRIVPDNPPYKSLKKGGANVSPAPTLKESSNEIISKNKSDYAVDHINNYWSMFLSQE